MPESSEFDRILETLRDTVAPHQEDIPAIGEAIRRFRERSRDATNLGETHDERDLYVLLDELIGSVREGHPGSRCRAGCSGCCDSSTAVFDAGPREWKAIERHMETVWSEAEREAFRARFAATHGPRLNAYRLLGLIRHFEPIADRYFAKHPYRCPFLIDGRCSIYAARPLACRMYGYFATRTRWYLPPAIYACSDQTAYYSSRRAEGPLHLPSTHMVLTRYKRLMGGRGRILPLWIARTLKTGTSRG